MSKHNYPLKWIIYGVLFILLGSACARIRDTHFRVQSNLVNVNCPLEFLQLSLCAQILPVRYPVQVEVETEFNLFLWKKNGGTPHGPWDDLGLTPYVRLWMKMASGGHGSLPVTTLASRETDGSETPGSYVARNINFTMPGEWEIHIELRKSDGSKVDEVVQKIEI